MGVVADDPRRDRAVGPPARVVAALRCPACGGALAVSATGSATGSGPSLRCPAAHTFDIARQGYVNLLPGGSPASTADPAQMVQARADFLDSGRYAPLTAALVRRVDGLDPRTGVVLDAGAGPGHHLAAVLRQRPESVGLALDVSKYAARRAARAHPRIGAVVTDIWHDLPVRTDAVVLVLNVFAPRNPAEFRRALRPDGALLVVTPTADHLGELVGPLGLLSVDAQKEDRLERGLAEEFRTGERELVAFQLALSRADVERVARMGPSAYHVPATELRQRVDALAEPVQVTAAVTVTTYHPRPSALPEKSG